MTTNHGHATTPSLNWLDRLLTCSVVLHDFECLDQPTAPVIRLRCKKCALETVYCRCQKQDGTIYWERVQDFAPPTGRIDDGAMGRLDDASISSPRLAR